MKLSFGQNTNENISRISVMKDYIDKVSKYLSKYVGLFWSWTYESTLAESFENFFHSFCPLASEFLEWLLISDRWFLKVDERTQIFKYIKV